VSSLNVFSKLFFKTVLRFSGSKSGLAEHHLFKAIAVQERSQKLVG